MVLLAFAWIVLMILEFTSNQQPWVVYASNVIWGVFVLDFLIRLFLAPARLAFIRRNWLTAISLLLPALRIFRITRVLRLARATRGLRLLRLGTSLNRSIRALKRSMERKGLGYVLALTLLVTFAGAAGMYALEEALYANYWEALWWTAMIITTMGSEGWPHSLEGRLLCLALAIYAFSVFGYVTAALASFLVERSKSEESPADSPALRELDELRQAVERLTNSINGKGS